MNRPTSEIIALMLAGMIVAVMLITFISIAVRGNHVIPENATAIKEILLFSLGVISGFISKTNTP
jgi:hypothetical protein